MVKQNPQRSHCKLGLALAPEPRYPESWPNVLSPHLTGLMVKGLECQAKETGPRKTGMSEQKTPGPRSEPCTRKSFHSEQGGAKPSGWEAALRT